MKKFGLTMMVIILAFGFHLVQAEATIMPLPTVVQLDAVYYLIGDSENLLTADSDTDVVKHVPAMTQSGFEYIDVVVEGVAGDTVTLLFGTAYDSETMPTMTLVGAEKFNSYVSWIPLERISPKASTEYGSLYRSNNLGVTTSGYKQGIKTRIGAYSSSQAAGVKINFSEIGRDDVYTVVTISMVGTGTGLEKSFRVLCVNRHRELLEREIVDDAIYNESSGYYEVNDPLNYFNDGQVIDSSAIDSMQYSGYKYVFFMDGYNVLVDQISDTTATQGDVVIKTDTNPNDVLRDRYADAAGGSVITFTVESGFVHDKVTYAIDLNSHATTGMSENEQSKWTDGKKVYCYIVDKNNLIDSGDQAGTNPIIGNNTTIPVSIQGGAIYIETDPESFDANQQMMMLTIEEIPVRDVAFKMNGGSTVDSQNVYTGDYASKPKTPIRAGYQFAGWYADEDLRTQFDFSSAILEDTTIYAKWKALASKRQVMHNESNEVNEENQEESFELPIEDKRIVFMDIAGHWAQTTIHDMVARKIILGYPDLSFGPDRYMTRAEFTVMLMRTLGLSERLGDSSFHDIKSEDWYSGFVEMGVQSGFLRGYPDGTFGPTHWITCEQARMVMDRVMAMMGMDGMLPTCESSGDGFITRSEAAVMMHELLNALF
ncbi:MAG: S-layer homology domain-containing protein [Tissierellales bacterium]|nr:S-layer homology domain-containing protein [Tissierellales bacterium]MBN2828073.1 S-layer homology domain-containing protein [Tissierellales bacterium]